MNREGAKQHLKTFAKGAKPDFSEHTLGSITDAYHSAFNMRNTGHGSATRLECIGGSVMITDYSNDRIFSITNPPDVTTYKCIGAIGSTTHTVGFFASTDPDSVTHKNYPLVVVDDKIVCYSDKLKDSFKYDRPLHVAVDDLLADGIVGVTNEFMTPQLWEIKDLIDTYDSLSYDTKYFNLFNLSSVEIRMNFFFDNPVFVELTTEGVGNGLTEGTYSYSIRYGTLTGDRTQWSISTPLIPVMTNYTKIDSTNEDNEGIYPCGRTWSAVPNETLVTKYGIKIKFRVCNLQNYQYIEVRRTKFIVNSPLNDVPAAEIYKIPVPLTDGLIDIWEFVDNKSTTWASLSTEQNISQLGEIKSAKDICFYNKRAVLFNIEYFDNIFNCDFISTTNSNLAYPILKNIGVEGHNDPYHFTYHKQYTRGEAFPFYLVAYDIMGQWSFAIPFDNGIVNLNEFQFPNRRDPVNAIADSKEYMNLIGEVAPNATDINNSLEDLGGGVLNGVPVFEAFDLPMVQDEKGMFYVNGKYKGAITAGNIRNINNPNRPYRYDDAACTYGENPMNQVIVDYEGTPHYMDYAPKIFAPDYYAMGLCIRGIKNIPSWVSSIQIVRGKPAGRVKTQGLISYYYNGYQTIHNYPSPEINDDSDIRSTIYKSANRVLFYSSDIDMLLANAPQADDIIEIVSPLGYVNEAYHSSEARFNPGSGTPLPNNSFFVSDQIIYPRLFATRPTADDKTTPKLEQKDGTPDATYWTKFGQWRNGGERGVSRKYKIVSVSSFKWAIYGRQTCYSLELLPLDGGDDIYMQTYQNWDTPNINNDFLQEFHEPFYVANIISENATSTLHNINMFEETGAVVKIKSLIGINSGSDISYKICSERLYDYSPMGGADNIFSYMYIEDVNGMIYPYVNISSLNLTLLSDLTLALGGVGHYDADNTLGFPVSFNIPTGTTTVYGAYNVIGDAIVFNTGLGRALATDDKIYVYYDDRVPIEVFGGDSVLTESLQGSVDGIYETDTDPAKRFMIPQTYTGLYNWWGCAFPFNRYNHNTQYSPMVNSYGSIGYMQSGDIRPTMLRQMCIMFTSESRADLNYAISTYHDYPVHQYPTVFPQVHYNMRPGEWTYQDPQWNITTDGGFVTPEAATYYQEYNIQIPPNPYVSGWAYGGFKITPGINKDYSKDKNDRVYVNQPIVGYVPKFRFPTRFHWSNQKDINIQDTPNLRTFLASSVYDAEEIYGEGKDMFVASSGKGENLYGFTEHGIVFCITNKTQLTDSNGSVIGYMPIGNSLIQGEIWESKDIGMEGDTWITACDWDEKLFFSNGRSCYLFDGGKLIDLGELGWINMYRNDGGDSIDVNTTAIYNSNYDEYWLTIYKKERKLTYTDGFPILLTHNKFNTTNEDVFFVKNGEYVSINSDGTPELIPITIQLETNTVGDFIIIKNNLVGEDIILQYTGVVERYANTDPPQSYNIPNDGNAYVFTLTELGFVVRQAKQQDLEYTISFSLRNIQDIKHADLMGKYEHIPERYLRKKASNSTYGFKDMKLYEYDSGSIVNNTGISYVIFPVSIAEGEPITKEWVNIAINTYPHVKKPSKIEFAENLYDVINNPLAELSMTSPSNPNPFYLKDYGNWSNFIPRKKEAPYHRFQNDVIWIKITMDETNMAISNVVIGEKQIKLL